MAHCFVLLGFPGSVVVATMFGDSPRLVLLFGHSTLEITSDMYIHKCIHDYT